MVNMEAPLARMVDDLLQRRPNFTVEGTELYWADRDGKTYRVEEMS